MIAKNDMLVKDYLESLKERATVALDNGNAVGAMYLACIAGMWSHITYHTVDRNIFQGVDGPMYNWFDIGFYASQDAAAMNDKLRAMFKEKEKNDALEKSKEKSKK